MITERLAPARGYPAVVTLPSGWRVGLLVCEDFWHPALLYLLAMKGADLILVMAAAVGRGDPAGASPEAGPLFSSPATWTLLSRAAALQYGVFLVLANRAGVEEGLTFAGESLVVSPLGGILARAPQAEPWTLDVTLSRLELRRSRSPYAHLRDDDPAYLLRALQGLAGEG